MKLIRHLVLDQCSVLISLRSAPHLCYINTHFCLTFYPTGAHYTTHYSLSSAREQEMNSYAAELAGILEGAAAYMRGRRIWSLYNIPCCCLHRVLIFQALLCNTRLSGQECVHIHPPLLKCMCDRYLPLCASRRLAHLMRAYGVWSSSMWPRTEALLCSAAVSSRQTCRQTLLV